MTRVALVHALIDSIAPLNVEMDKSWPACERMNLLDDSLSADLSRSSSGLDASFDRRFMQLAEYAVATGAQGILFSCSAFGPCIERVARRFSTMPVLKPNEAMIAESATCTGPVALIATFAPTLRSMIPEFPDTVDVRPVLAESALTLLQAGDRDRHDAIVTTIAERLVGEGCATIALAQFSMSHLATPLARHLGVPVLNPLTSAVQAMKHRLQRTVAST